METAVFGPLIIYPATLAMGVVVSFINSWAGGGSTLSLPIFFFFGIPAAVAHGTNRFGLIWGNISSVLSLRRAGHLKLTHSLKFIVPMSLGAVGGSFIAVDLPDRIFNILVAIVIIGITFFTNMNTDNPGEDHKNSRLSRGSKTVIYFLAGVYGGFIQVGTGFIMIFIFNRIIGKNPYETNALKGVGTFLILVISVIIFIYHGLINWQLALTFAAGCWIGGHLGGRHQVTKDPAWIKIVIRIMGAVMVVKLIAQSVGG